MKPPAEPPHRKPALREARLLARGATVEITACVFNSVARNSHPAASIPIAPKSPDWHPIPLRAIHTPRPQSRLPPNHRTCAHYPCPHRKPALRVPRLLDEAAILLRLLRLSRGLAESYARHRERHCENRAARRRDGLEIPEKLHPQMPDQSWVRRGSRAPLL